jgi:DNA-binding CsgD family transcriptional regulator
MTDDDREHYETRDFGLETSSGFSGPLNGRSSEAGLTRLVPEPAWFFAACADDLQPQAFDLKELWQGLCAGTWQFRDTFSSAEKHFGVVERVSLGKRSRVQQRNLEMLTRVLLGQVPKAVAQDIRVAISTVATGTQECLRSMGLPQRASSPPVLLMMAARAAESACSAPTLGRLTRIKAQDETYWLVSVQRLDLEFPVSLSEAEAAVVRQLVSGHTHAQISKRRATSPRTVANQLASAFKKFGVSGRTAILQRLISHCFEHQATSLAASAPLSD